MGYIENLRSIVGHRLILLTGVGVLVINDRQQILLQNNAEGCWGIPGGFMELGETAEDAGKREVFEETGIQVDQLKLVTVVSGDETYKKLANGDEYYSVTIVYSTTHIIGGKLEADGIETFEVAFFELKELPENISKLSKTIINEYKTTRQE